MLYAIANEVAHEVAHHLRKTTPGIPPVHGDENYPGVNGELGVATGVMSDPGVTTPEEKIDRGLSTLVPALSKFLQLPPKKTDAKVVIPKQNTGTYQPPGAGGNIVYTPHITTKKEIRHSNKVKKSQTKQQNQTDNKRIISNMH